MQLKLVGLALLSALLAAIVASAQPQFDVGSIKPAPPNERNGGYRFDPGGRTVVSDFTLKNLVMVAWHVQDFQLSGRPPWFDSDSARYDIEAKAEGNPSEAESRRMLESLLADRFHLALHHETRELPIYVLVSAKSGVHGAGLVPSKEGECTPRPQDFPPPLEPGLPPYCGFAQRLRRQDTGPPLMQFHGAGITLGILARTLGTVLDRHVEDDTGIGGSYDMTFEYAPDDDLQKRVMPDTPTSDGSLPSLFTALQEQLGLRLEPRKGPIEVLVIDRAERPSAN